MKYKNDRKNGQHISSIPNLHLWIPAVSRPRKTYGHLNSILNRFYLLTVHFKIFLLYHKVATFYLFPRLSTCENLRFQIGRLCVQGLSAPVLLAFVFYLQTLKLGGKRSGDFMFLLDNLGMIRKTRIASILKQGQMQPYFLVLTLGDFDHGKKRWLLIVEGDNHPCQNDRVLGI